MKKTLIFFTSVMIAITLFVSSSIASASTMMDGGYKNIGYHYDHNNYFMMDDYHYRGYENHHYNQNHYNRFGNMRSMMGRIFSKFL